MDREFLFNTIKNEVELLLKKDELLDGIIFSPKIDEYPDSPFNMTIQKGSKILEFVGEEYAENHIKEKLEQIFEKYDHFSEIVDNTIHILPF